MSFVSMLARRATAALPVSTRPFFISICGWADTGKSTLAGELCNEIRECGLSADWISTDAFLLDRVTRSQLGLTGYNPASINSDEMMTAVSLLSNGVPYEYYPYVNRTGTRADQPRTLNPQTILVIEGIHSLHRDLLPHLHYKLFIEAAVEVLRDLRIRANINKRGMEQLEARRRVEMELEDFFRYTSPARQHVDCIVTINRSPDSRRASAMPGEAHLVSQ